MFWIIELDVWVEEKLRRKFQLPPGKKKIFMWLENFFSLKFHEIFKVHISLYRKKNAHTHQLLFFFLQFFTPIIHIPTHYKNNCWWCNFFYTESIKYFYIVVFIQQL